MIPVKAARPTKFENLAKASSPPPDEREREKERERFSAEDILCRRDFERKTFRIRLAPSEASEARLCSLEELSPWLEELSQQLAVAEVACLPGSEHALCPKLFVLLRCLCGLVSSPISPPQISVEACAELVEEIDEEDEDQEEESPSTNHHSRSGAPPTVRDVRTAIDQYLRENDMAMRFSAKLVVHFAQRQSDSDSDDEASEGYPALVPRLVVKAKPSIANNSGFWQLYADMASLQESNGVDDKGAYLPVYGALTDFENWIFVKLSPKRTFFHTIKTQFIDRSSTVDYIPISRVVLQPRILPFVTWFLNVAEGPAAASVPMNQRIQNMMRTKMQLGNDSLFQIRQQIEIERKAKEAAERAREEAERKAKEVAERAREAVKRSVIQALRKNYDDENESFNVFSLAFPTESRAEFELLWKE